MDVCCGSGVRDQEELEDLLNADTNFLVTENLEDLSEAQRCQIEEEQRDESSRDDEVGV